MKMIGITGGVGAGKSELLHYINEQYNARILLADELAHDLMEPGTACYQQLYQSFGTLPIYEADGHFDRVKLAQEIFSNEKRRETLNQIVHPAVKQEVLRIKAEEERRNEISYLVLEAALLIEERYDEICDELWYIYTSEDNRRSRLKMSRGYSDEKIASIFASQLSEDTYRRHCKVVIDNNGTREHAFSQIDLAFAERDAAEQNLSERNTAQQFVTEKNSAEQNGAEKNITEQNTVKKNVTEKNTAVQNEQGNDKSGKTAIRKDYMENETIEKDRSGKTATDQETVEKDTSEYEELDSSYVFGLDIGTRNVVGTVGYRQDKKFYVAAQYTKEHETRAMLDGQIHDIGRVAGTIREVKDALEHQLHRKLTQVCIAAAGRVLVTETVMIEREYPEETVVSKEDIHTLELQAIDQAGQQLREKKNSRYKFYCVGYSVVKAFLNEEPFSSLEGHKADKIAEEIIVTFLPEDVVDGLYNACEQAGLYVLNLTLEPIAAIGVAVPEKFRMLNIALVDVGAGTSDICVTKDGSITAYGMIPLAGDEISDVIVQQYLVDFDMAEHMKLSSMTDEDVEYQDIMGLTYTVKAEEIWKLAAPVVERITTEVAEKIRKLNGDSSVSAAFIVGGGGKIHGFTELLAEKLGLIKERVALRGEEVLGDVIFEQKDVKKDPLLVTPIGICLNYYEQKNSFIMVQFNGEPLKIYDNSHLTVADAAIAAGFPNDQLFPRRGTEVTYTVDGKTRFVRGEAGESAQILVNGQHVNLNEPLIANSLITIIPSTAGEAVVMTLEQLPEYSGAGMTFCVNGTEINCPKYLEVNGRLETPSYEIKDGDAVRTRNYYLAAQIADFMDVEIEEADGIWVNNRPASKNTMVYENFTVEFTPLAKIHTPEEGFAITSFVQNEEGAQDKTDVQGESAGAERDELTQMIDSEDEGKRELDSYFDEFEENGLTDLSYGTSSMLISQESPQMNSDVNRGNQFDVNGHQNEQNQKESVEKEFQQTQTLGNGSAQINASDQKNDTMLTVMINGRPVTLTGKPDYIFVDIFDFINFDLKESNGRPIVTNINGKQAMYTQPLAAGDTIEIYWKEK